MKKNNLLIYILVLSISIFFSCDKDLDENNEQFPQLNPSNQDENAGNWVPILLSSNEEFTIENPLEINSSNYLSELNEIKSFQKNITQEEREIVKYWSAGSVLRWNEIMRSLVAKHNIPPSQNEDGTYPIPSSVNPFANPEFPFSSPPYAARAFAYVSAAQYDGLVAAWHYKFVYNRQSPYLVDNTIKVLVPQNTLPSYPSEDAVIGGATVEMLKLLFPTEIAYINKKLEEQKLYRIISGANVRSEVDAGISLGKKIAGKFITRAKTDGAGLAVGTPEIWSQMQFQTEASGEIPWKSLENPPRPPMLPLFKNVKSFFLTAEMITNNRPIPPPSTNSQEFIIELNEVKRYCNNANRNQVRIVNFWADGIGTYTPPGHWNSIASTEFVKQNYSEVRWARNMCLLNIAMMDAAISCWDAKFTYFNPRPSQIDPSIKTWTGVPNFPAYVSGHSTFSGAAATFLSHILPEKSTDFTAMANEASVSRMYGGIHYRSDCEQGLILGKKVGEVTIQRALSDGAE